MQQGRDLAFREPRGGRVWRARWVGDRGSPPADVPHDNRKELAGSDAIGLDPTFHGFTVPAGIQTVDRRAVHYMLTKLLETRPISV